MAKTTKPSQSKPIYPMLATPCYDAQVTQPFLLSMINLSIELTKRSIPFQFETISGSLVPQLRNQIVSKFLDSSECTHLFWIDSDTGFGAPDVLSLLHRNKDVIGAASPYKFLDWEFLRKGFERGLMERELAESGLRYVVNFSADPESISVDGDLISAEELGTGFTCVSREALQKIISNYPDLYYFEGPLKCYGLYSSTFDSQSRRLLSEGHFFSKLWRSVGGTLWIDPSIRLSHLGRYNFEGSLAESYPEL